MQAGVKFVQAMNNLSQINNRVPIAVHLVMAIIYFCSENKTEPEFT